MEQIIATLRSILALWNKLQFQAEIREMSTQNAISSFKYGGGKSADNLDKIRCLEGNLRQKEIQLEHSHNRFERIFTLISEMLSVDGPAPGDLP